MKNENRLFVYDKWVSKKVRFIVRMVMPFLDVYYNILLLIATWKNRATKFTEKRFYLSICAIFKNEGLSLKEWIEYYILLGVDHFYLYNNLSTDDYQEILKPYIDKGIVDLIEWAIPPPSQFAAYEDCFNAHRQDSKWIAFIDLDEFICPYYELSIKDWVKKYEKYPSVVIYWKMFGTSGLLNHDNNRLITEQYFISWKKFFSLGKVIFNTDFEVYRFDARELHVLSAKLTLFNKVFAIPPINEFKKYIKYKNNRIGFFNSIDDFTIQINHYASKSLSSYISGKILRGDVNNHVRNLDMFLWQEHYQMTCDYKMWRFLIQLKINMGMVDQFQELLDFKSM